MPQCARSASLLTRITRAPIEDFLTYLRNREKTGISDISREFQQNRAKHPNIADSNHFP